MTKMNETPTQHAVTKIIPPVWLLITMISMWLLHGIIPFSPLFDDSAEWIGKLMVFGGFGLVFYCAKMFAKARTPLKPFEPVKAVLTDGPYKVSRNPVYLGMLILLCGWAIALGSVTPWFGVFFFAWFIRSFWIIPEEVQMEREMGKTYLDYKSKVRRWI